MIDINKMSVPSIWEFIETTANEHMHLNEQLIGVFHIQLTGDNGGDYTVHFRENDVEVTATQTEDATCQLTMTVEHFKLFLQGKLNSFAAFMSGKLKVKGDMPSALRLEKVLHNYVELHH